MDVNHTKQTAAATAASRPVIARRRVLRLVGAGGLFAATGRHQRSIAATTSGSKPMGRAGEVPHSAGSSVPDIEVPASSCDCHMHFFSQRFPMAAGDTRVLPDATVEHYRLLQERLGTSRVVVVQPSTYGTDNRLLTEALGQLGPSACGIAVVDPTVSDDELSRLASAGVRGIRFNIARAGAMRVEMIEPLAARIRSLGWHVQIHMEADEIAHLQPLFSRLDVPIVFDHMGRIPVKAGPSHPAFAVIRRLLEKEQAWVKLSGAYLVSSEGDPAYADVAPLARAFYQARPDRMLWGSDWPHPSAKVKPDDARLLDLLGEWVADRQGRQRILVDNPQALYGFRA